MTLSFYQDNIKHKSRIIFTVSVLNRQRRYLDIQLSIEFCNHVSQKIQEWGESSKTPLNFNQQITMTMKISNKLTTSNHKLLVLIIPL